MASYAWTLVAIHAKGRLILWVYEGGKFCLMIM
jgi:hypothetical protein